VIAVRNLTFAYDRRARPAVTDVSFEVGRGEIFGLLGPSGAGKSTIQKVLIGLLRKYAGKVEVFGREVSAWDARFYEHIGVAFELPNHYERLTPLEELRLFASFYERRTRNPMELLKLVGLEESADRRIESMSKGMKMRLNFVRALIHDPEVLFLDEPTSGLDPLNAEQVKRMVVELRERGKAILLTTHNMADANALCDRVGLIVSGRVARIDSPAALRASFGSRRVRVEYRDGAASKHAIFELAGLGSNHRFLALIREHEVESIHSEDPSLTEVFAAVVEGRPVAFEPSSEAGPA
jgi:fluoroquinolone transport system ATP-binding protein